MEQSAPTPAEERELDRVGAFSDGVFAIAITLLVLNIDVPHVAGHDLGKALSDLSGDIVTYGIGFAVMGLFWYAHHKLFARLGRSSGRFVAVNMVLLALIALMPFTTAVLGRYDGPVAVALYACNVGIAMLLDGLLEVVAIDDGLFEQPRLRARREVLVSAGTEALVFFASIPIAYAISPSLAKWFWLLLIPAGRAGRLSRRKEKDAKAAA
jgi:TMEM175 potassium channel family protein